MMYTKNRDGVLRFAWYTKGNPLKVHHVHHFLEPMVIRRTTLTCARVYETRILLYMLYFHTVLPGKRGETVYTNGFRWCTRAVHLVCSDDVLPGKRGETAYTNGAHGRSHTLMALTLRARLPVRMRSRPEGALTSFALSRPPGRGLGCFEGSTHSTTAEPHRELVTSRRSQQTRDQTPSCPAEPAGASRS